MQKTGILPKFTQPTPESASGFLSTCALPTPKFPTKITGNFSDYNRELSANIREIVIGNHKTLDFLYLKKKEINEMEVNYEQVRD